eukprot:9590860-Lingulodinium_polyedra.AAC.1
MRSACDPDQTGPQSARAAPKLQRRQFGTQGAAKVAKQHRSRSQPGLKQRAGSTEPAPQRIQAIAKS